MKKKKVLSLLLSATIAVTMLMPFSRSVLAEEKYGAETENNGTNSENEISPMSLLPLEEINAYLVVGEHKGVDISKVSLDLILNSLMDSDGNPIIIDKDAKVVWCYCKDQDGSTITDDYFVIEKGGTVDLSIYEEYERYTLEMIVGDGNQLNPNNIRYIVTVYLSDTISGLRTYELYTQDEDGTRHKVVPVDQFASSSTLAGMNSSVRTFIVPEHVEGTEYYLGINDPLDEHPFIQCDVMNYADYFGFIIYQNMGLEYDYENLADQFINLDMTEKDAGYKSIWDTPEVTENSVDITNTFAFVYKNSFTGDILYHELYTFIVTNDAPYFEDSVYVKENDEFKDAKLESTSHTSIEEIDYDNIFGITDSDLIRIKRVILNKGYSINDEYYYALFTHNPSWDNANDHVVKATVGWYDSIESAEQVEDISDQLLPKSSNTDFLGYKENYSIDNGGIKFTVFFDDGTYYKLLIVFQEYDKSADLNYMREFTDKPIIGEADPWFRVIGAVDSDVNEYNIENNNAYIVENGKSINMDTYYGYGYQTVFIKDDSGKDIDLTNIEPKFDIKNDSRLYLVSDDTGNLVKKGHTRNFEENNQQYTLVFDNNNETVRNYWITFKKINNTGPELYVFGPSEREVILDKYFEYKHDILIANIGNAPLEYLSVELLDAEHVKLDPYWTVGGANNDTLAPFTMTSSDTKYGEISNIAKIRLLPDGDGEVKGTLIIKAKDQEPVLIELNGKAQQPEIVTKTLSNAVKYVPYSHIIATNNIHDWNEVTFELYSGELPNGVELNTQTGEIYGTPKEAGEYRFTVEAKYTYFDSSFVELKLTVKNNTNDNVFYASDDKYDLQQAIGVDQGGHNYFLDSTDDQLFVSNGVMGEFIDLWLNGEKLVKGTDYTVESGSTRITVISQTFENKANREGINTIAAEFRVDGDLKNELKRTAQNFTLDKNAVNQNPGSTGGSGSSTPSDPSDGDTDPSNPSDSTEPSVKYIKFSGYIVDTNGKALPDLTVEIHSTPQSTVTDRSGYFEFEKVELGEHTIYVKDAAGNILASKVFNIIESDNPSVSDNVIVIGTGDTSAYVQITVGDNELSFTGVSSSSDNNSDDASDAAPGEPSNDPSGDSSNGDANDDDSSQTDTEKPIDTGYNNDIIVVLMVIAFCVMIFIGIFNGIEISGKKD